MTRLPARAGVLLALVVAGCAGSRPAIKAPEPRASVAPPPPALSVAPAPAAVPTAPSLAPIHFDYDQALIHAVDAPTLEALGAYLQASPGRLLTISGHTDERGTVEYNIALGDRRAVVAREDLIRLGVGPERIRTISYGESRPVEPAHDEEAWARNRRDEFQVEEQQRADGRAGR